MGISTVAKTDCVRHLISYYITTRFFKMLLLYSVNKACSKNIRNLRVNVKNKSASKRDVFLLIQCRDLFIQYKQCNISTTTGCAAKICWLNEYLCILILKKIKRRSPLSNPCQLKARITNSTFSSIVYSAWRTWFCYIGRRILKWFVI